MNFVPLHINTEYSFQESTIKIDELIEKAVSLNLKSLAITDHNSMFGVLEFVTKVKSKGIKPIIGLDLDVEDFRLILLAKNYDGYKLLNKLSSKKMRNIEINRDEVESSDLFVIDHPTLGFFKKYDKQLDIENYFIGSDKESYGDGVFVQEGKALKDVDLETLDLVTKMAGKDIDISNIKPIDWNPSKSISSVEQSIKIAEECNVVWPDNINPVPKYKNPTGLSSIKYLKKLLQGASAKKLKGVNNINVYLDRIRYEVSIIEKLGFEDYFLIIWDLIAWAKKENIAIGPGRGSAAGSLVSYLLDITEIDPIKFDLLFERFLNPERATMPDIDIDIQDSHRENVTKYLFEKYTEQHTALISTFSRLGAKSSLRDVARFMNIPVRDVNTISKLIPSDLSLKEAHKQSSKFRAIIDSSDEYTKLFRLSSLIEGLPRQYSTHAAGVVVSDGPIIDKAPTIEGPDSLNQVQYSMDYLEDIGLLKIDLLGLKNLTIIKRIQEEIYINHNKRVDLLKIPLNDKKTNELLSSGNTNGVFQLESYGMKRTLVEVGVSNFDDLVAIVSLFRPGPMENISLYSKVKNGELKMESIDGAYDEIVSPTHGIIVYQEQIMQIAQKYANMSFGQADILRRAIGKKKHKLIETLKETFMNGSIKNGHTKEQALKIYQLIEKFANYGFNKSHAVAYSVLAYRMAFLKARFKFEFYTALLESSISSQATVQKYVFEAKEQSINVISPDINLSERKVINKNNDIILPLQLIKGFGDSAAGKILEERSEAPFKDFFDFVIRAKLSGIGESVIQLLIEANALRTFGNSQTLLDTLPSALRYAKMITITKDGKKIIYRDIISKPKMIVQERNIESEIFNEKKLLGFQMNVFATTGYELEEKLTDIKPGDTKRVVILVERIRKNMAKNGTSFGRVTASDSTTYIEIMSFYETFKFIENTKQGTLVEASIECKIRNGSKNYILKSPWKEIKNG